MESNVLEQIARLGGSYVPGRVEPLTCDDGEGYGPWGEVLVDRHGGGRGGPVVEELLAVSFPAMLQERLEPLPWDPTGLDALSAVVEQYPEVVGEDDEVNVDLMVDRVFNSPGGFCHQFTYDPWVFAPFTPGSPTSGELDGLVTEESLRETFKISSDVAEPLEFVMIAHSEGFPNFYVVATSDPNPGNPNVFSTDHETFFWEDVEPAGTLADVLAKFTTPTELRQYLAEPAA
ncbi:MAG: hypothetical protein FWD11_12555 [Micrococcales bacterium]|nr:hypothetical protein [Micrococcales bacterium]